MPVTSCTSGHPSNIYSTSTLVEANNTVKARLKVQYCGGVFSIVIPKLYVQYYTIAKNANIGPVIKGLLL